MTSEMLWVAKLSEKWMLKEKLRYQTVCTVSEKICGK